MKPEQKAEQYASSQYDTNQYTEPDSVKGTGWTDCRDAWMAGYEAANERAEYLAKRLAAAEYLISPYAAEELSIAYQRWQVLRNQDNPKTPTL